MKDALGSVQSIVVLGATSEIGAATVRRLAGPGTRTAILAARDPDRIEVAEDLRRAGVENVETVAFDARATETHDAFVSDVFSRHGDVDLVLVAFGILGDESHNQSDAEAALEVMETNYTGAVSVAIPVVRRLRDQGHGTIVFLSSVAGERARKSNYVYGSSKAAIDAFAQGLGDSLEGSGVKVMVVRPGFVRTKMTEGMDEAPLATDVDAVADAIAAGLRRGAHTVWAPGALRFVFSALRHLPRPVFKRLDI